MNSNLKEIYLDANATTFVLPQAIAAAERAMRDCYGNPSSTHCTGLRAKALLDSVRTCAARVLGAGQGKILFTSGATEGIQTAVLSALCNVRARRECGEQTGDLLLYGATEHKAVPESLTHWNQVLGLNCRVVAIPVDKNGRHDLAFLRRHVSEASLVCTMAANNETGVISDLEGIDRTLSECVSRPLWLVDCVQALGKLALKLAQTNIDYAPFSGHKLYAPKGIGLLYVRNGAPFTPLIAGGGQESGFRSGTENMTGIAALGAVLEVLEQGHIFSNSETLEAYREQLIAALSDALPNLIFNAPLELSLPTTLNFSVPGFPAKELLDLFDAAGIRVSSGSACSASKALPSYVLKAMGIPDKRAGSAIRMSFGPATTLDDIAAACARIRACGAALRKSCRIPTAESNGFPHNGLIQLVSNGACSWLLADAESRTCIIINPIGELSARLEAYVRCQDYRVRAILDTHRRGDYDFARQDLVSILNERLIASGEAPDSLGWPGACTLVKLQNGESAEMLQLGSFSIARFALPGHTADSVAYLVGRLDANGQLQAKDIRYAFTGNAILIGKFGTTDSATGSASDLYVSLRRLATAIDEHTLICPAQDPHDNFVTTLAAEQRANHLLARALDSSPLPVEIFVKEKAALEAADQYHDASMDATDSHGLTDDPAAIDIPPEALNNFLHDRSNALLVDVREAYEHGISNIAIAQADILNVPLTRLADDIGQWLRAQQRRPLIFFCRSGKRGMAAAHCLRRLGYADAWNLSGGVALTAQT